MLGRSLNLSRNVMQNALRNYHGGVPGAVSRKYKLIFRLHNF